MEMSANLKSKEIAANISLLQNELRHFPVITCVKGSDGKEDHSIAIYSGWIFDANFTHALPLCQESLNECCSSDEVKCTFVCFLQSFYFEYFGTYVTAHNDGDRNEKKRAKKKDYKKRKKQKLLMLLRQYIS